MIKPIRDLFAIVEIFKSIEGEGIRTGLPTVFVRFSGCNLRCGYCDTTYGQTNDNSLWLTKEEICHSILSYNCKNITFTGGEPLLYVDFINWFTSNKRFCNYSVNIETNGSRPISEVCGHSFIITMDFKCVSSGMSAKMDLSNFQYLHKHDVLKFVVGTDEDLAQVEKIIYEYNPICHIYLSPVFGIMDFKKLASFVIDRHFLNLRIGLQIHKIIWNPDTRGV